MAQPDPDSREFRQMRHDVDDVYALLTDTQKAVEGAREMLGTLWGVQRRHGNRLEEIQQSLDLQSGRLDRMEDTQRTQGDRLGRIEDTQQQQGDRLGRIEDTQQQQGDRLGRMEGTQLEQGDRLGRVETSLEEILALLRGRSTG